MRAPALFIKAFLISVFFIGFLTSCDKRDEFPDMSTEDYSSQVVIEWMDLILKLTKDTPGFTPPVVARAFGYIGLGAYESVRLGMPGYRSMAGQVNGFSPDLIPQVDPNDNYHWGIVANSAIATLIKGCYTAASAGKKVQIDELEARLNEQYRAEVSTDIFDRSIRLGKSVGAKIMEYADTDGQADCYKNNFPETFTPPVGAGLWVPTPPAYQRTMQPYWGAVRPFMAKNVTDADLLPPPPDFSTNPNSKFYKETLEVYITVKNLSEEQLTIANFWSDDPGKTVTPPGHSLSILKQILNKEQADLGVAAVAFAKLGMGLHDAFVACWRVKYAYNLIRPITVIHDHIDPLFEIPLDTPPFPEYTSGHSVQSATASQILTDLFGDHYAFNDSTNVGRSDINGSPRAFASFYDFAEEAAISRLYGGIHYRSAIENGLEQGKGIGKNISTLRFK